MWLCFSVLYLQDNALELPLYFQFHSFNMHVSKSRYNGIYFQEALLKPLCGDCVLSSVFRMIQVVSAVYCWAKHHDPEQCGTGRAHFFVALWVNQKQRSAQDLLARLWWQEVTQSPWRSAAQQLALHSLLCLLLSTHDHPPTWGSVLHSGWPFHINHQVFHS